MASTRAPLRPWVANSSVATARMSALERSASLANSSPAVLAAAFFFRLAIHPSSSRTALLAPLGSGQYTIPGPPENRRSRDSGRQVLETGLRSEPDGRIARAVAVVNTSLDDFEEEALDESAGIQMVIRAGDVLVVQDVELGHAREHRILQAIARTQIVIVVRGDRQEFHAEPLQSRGSVEDVVGRERDTLHPGPGVSVQKVCDQRLRGGRAVQDDAKTAVW